MPSYQRSNVSYRVSPTPVNLEKKAVNPSSLLSAPILLILNPQISKQELWFITAPGLYLSQSARTAHICFKQVYHTSEP